MQTLKGNTRVLLYRPGLPGNNPCTITSAVGVAARYLLAAPCPVGTSQRMQASTLSGWQTCLSAALPLITQPRV